MNQIVLISCASKKLSHPASARELYQSTLFQYALKYAELMQPDHVFILSAKHGLLELNEIIKPYDITLNSMRNAEAKEWGRRVLSQLNHRVDLNKDEFIFLAGDRYRKYLIPSITNYRIPLLGLPIGKQLQKLKQLCIERQK